MDFKKSLKDVVVLVVICAVFATVLAAVNSVTAPIIADRLEQAANEAYIAVMPGAQGFDNVDLSGYTLPSTVVEAKKEKSGMGFAIKLSAKGYSTGMIIIVGVDANGVVTGATCISSGETWGLEKTFGNEVVGTDVNTIVDVQAGATSLTINGYRSAVKDAINAAAILSGQEVDIRTEEEKFQDALEAALPEGGEAFTKLVLLVTLDGIDAVYQADNGAGYVCVIGNDSTGTFIGVDANGKAVGDSEHNAKAEAAIATVKANEAVDVDLDPYMGNSLIANSVNYVKKTGSGTYLIELKTTGQYTEGTPIVVLVAIDANGKILDAQTVSNGETENIGGMQLQDGKFNSNFIGKDETEAGGVDTVAGVTFTTNAFKNAVLNAFNVVKILGGEEVDTRTEEEKFADALAQALPGSDAFTKVFMVEIVDGFDAIYKANNGAGYVCVIGNNSEGTFVGVDSNGTAVGDSEHNAKAESVVAIVSATVLTDVDVSMYNQSGVATDIRRIFRMINSVQKTESGNYVIEIQCDGHGKKGDPSHEHASGERYVIKVSISADGVIIDSQTLYHSETSTWGGPQLEDGAYNSNFIGKDEAGANGVDTVAGTTNTTSGYKEAILRCFAAIDIIEGGTN